MAAKDELVRMLNDALRLEHAARIQYLAHAQQATTPAVIARLQEIAEDERKHEDTFRELIGAYLDSVPTMEVGETHQARSQDDIIDVNIQDEKHAIDVYISILEKIRESRDEFKYEYFQLEHGVRHVIQDEQEHVSELKLLLAKP
jgi:rubrerythrin